MTAPIRDPAWPYDPTPTGPNFRDNRPYCSCVVVEVRGKLRLETCKRCEVKR